MTAWYERYAHTRHGVRVARFFAIACLGLGACGRQSRPPSIRTPDAAASSSEGARKGAATPRAEPIIGDTVDVRMIGGKAGYRFDPDSVSLKQGDGIKFSVVSGTHNVTFWPDSIPVGAQEQLTANMLLPTASAPLTGPISAKGSEYVVSFAGVPAGTYKGYCTPHLPMGMKLTVIVR